MRVLKLLWKITWMLLRLAFALAPLWPLYRSLPAKPSEMALLGLGALVWISLLIPLLFFREFQDSVQGPPASSQEPEPTPDPSQIAHNSYLRAMATPGTPEYYTVHVIGDD